MVNIAQSIIYWDNLKIQKQNDMEQSISYQLNMSQQINNNIISIIIIIETMYYLMLIGIK